jgi:ribosomal subunit interface protein
MKLTLRSHHATVPPELRDHAERKLSRLERLLPRIDDVIVEVSHEETRAAAHRYAVQVTVHSGTSILRGEERAADAQTALDRASDVVSRQARRHGKRLHARHRSGQPRDWAPPEESVAAEEPEHSGEPEPEYLGGKVVRRKQLELKPMSEEEALAQMDLLGHDFFLFLDARTSELALLYKRKDGDYGLLEPDHGASGTGPSRRRG